MMIEKYELFAVEPVLLVDDVAATLAFYADVLGFSRDFEHGSPPVHGRVCWGDPGAAGIARIRFELAAAPVPEVKSCYLYLYVGAGLDDLFATYQSRGVEIVGAPTDRPWGLRQFEIRDCNAYVLTFVSELAGAM